MIVEDHGTELVDVLVAVNLVNNGIVAIASVIFIEEHFEKDRRVLVAIHDEFHLLSLDKIHLLLILRAKHSQQLLVGLSLSSRCWQFFLV